jgi:hypothetical protein
MFLLDVQQGRESFIPGELCQDHLPWSYRFYDPILEVVQNYIDEDRKEYFFSKNMLNYKNFKETNMKERIYQKYLSGGEKSELTFRYNIVNKKESNIIDHNQSEYTMNL